MTTWYEILEISDKNGNGTGAYRYTVRMGSSANPIGLCNHYHASPKDAEDCPDAKDRLDIAFSRGIHAVREGMDVMLNKKHDDLEEKTVLNIISIFKDTKEVACINHIDTEKYRKHEDGIRIFKIPVDKIVRRDGRDL